MRIRLTMISAIVTLIALTIGAVGLDRVLSTSLIDEVDRSITNRAIDVATSIDDTNELSNASFPVDFETFVGIVEFPDQPVLEIHNDANPDAAEILAALDGVETEQPIDASLPSLGQTSGNDNLRLVAADVETGDEIVVVARSLDGVDRTLATVRRIAAVAVPALAAAVALMVWIMAGRALEPVEAIRSEVDDIAGRDLSRRVPEPNATDEIGRLARTMNSMLGRLEAAQHRERRFSADVAHELRSPLTSITAQLDVGLAHADRTDWADMASDVRCEAERMQRLVDDLLSLARSEAGDRVGRPLVLVDVDDVVFDIVTTHRLSTTVEFDLSGVSGATARMAHDDAVRVIDNLLANASRHATHRVMCQLRTESDRVVLIVDDDGPGVPTDERDAVFERFVRLDNARSRDSGGTGLGLALVRELVHRHGGSVTLSDAPIGGARFRVELPAAS